MGTIEKEKKWQNLSEVDIKYIVRSIFIIFLLSCSGNGVYSNYQDRMTKSKQLVSVNRCITSLEQTYPFRDLSKLEYNYFKFLEKNQVKEDDIPNFMDSDATIDYPLEFSSNDLVNDYEELKNNEYLMPCLFDLSVDCEQVDEMIVKVKKLLYMGNRYKFAYCDSKNDENFAYDLLKYKSIINNYDSSSPEYYKYLEEVLGSDNYAYFFQIRKHQIMCRSEDTYVMYVNYLSDILEIEDIIPRIENSWSNRYFRLKLVPASETVSEFPYLYIKRSGSSRNYTSNGTIYLSNEVLQKRSLFIAVFTHEIGHFLGFPDCYQEFVKENRYIYYEIVKNNIMCSLKGYVTSFLIQELIKNYCD